MQDADDDEQEDALDDEVVLVRDRPEDLVAEAGVGEDDLGHQCARR